METISFTLPTILLLIGILILLFTKNGELDLLGLGLIIMAFTITRYDVETSQQIDLPEEYKLITKETPIQGYYDKDSVLHIEFKHNYK